MSLKSLQILHRFNKCFLNALSKNAFTTSSRLSAAKIIDGVALAKEMKDEVKADIEACVAAGQRPPQLTVIQVGEDPASKAYISNKIKACKYTGKDMSKVILISCPPSVSMYRVLKADMEARVAAGQRPPQLTVIQVGEDHASKAYIGNKIKACKYTGIVSDSIHLPVDTSQEELLGLIKEKNEDNGVDGLLVQLPVPKHMTERIICNAVHPTKDVDGFNVINVGKFCSDQRSFVPATPAGVMEILRRTGIETYGKNAVVCGRSKNVGMPISMLLHADGIYETKAGDATTTICHRYTPPEQLEVFTKTADIIVVAVGIPKLIKAHMIKEGAAIIDVGINRVKDEKTGKMKLVGDVEFEEVSKKAGYITPVPGGVGPITVAMLMKNTLMAYKKEITFD